MASPERPSFSQYPRWLRGQFGYRDDSSARNYFETVVERIRSEVAADFWPSVLDAIREASDEYQVEHGYPLLIGADPVLLKKTYDSTLLKSYRRNVLNNDRWPEQPISGWTNPNTWYAEIPDLVRGLSIVKYMDGVQYLSTRIRTLCLNRGYEIADTLEARIEGYYAAHIQIRLPIEIPRRDWSTTWIEGGIELQITTQLQEIVRGHLHKYYEVNRLRETVDPTIWQWDHRTDEFAVNYLGHVLHYLEGKIMEIRDAQERSGL